MIDINKFLQLNNPDIARQTRNMSYFDALKSEIPGTKSYQGYNPFYKGADKTGLSGYLKQGIDSVQGKFKPGSNVGGATWLTRKLAQDSMRLGIGASSIGRSALARTAGTLLGGTVVGTGGMLLSPYIAMANHLYGPNAQKGHDFVGMSGEAMPFYGDADMYEEYSSYLGKQKTSEADLNLSKTLADSNLSKTLSNLVFTPAYGDIPTKEEREGLYSFNNLVSDTVMAEPNQFQDYPGVENLGGVQNFDLEGVRDIISQMEEEKGNYIERPEDGFNMEGILQSLGGFAKNTAGRYIGSQALGGAGGMLFGPIGGLVGGIIGALKGGDLFNQNTYSQQMYNNLTPGGKAYASSLYGPGGALEGYNQFSAFGKGTLGTIGNILAKNPNMSLARQNIYRTAADKYISGIDPTQQGYNAVTKKGGYGYDDAYINYAPPSGGGKDSGSGDGWSGGSGSDWGSGFDSDQATL
jgi:hypothetical protein